MGYHDGEFTYGTAERSKAGRTDIQNKLTSHPQ